MTAETKRTKVLAAFLIFVSLLLVLVCTALLFAVRADHEIRLKRARAIEGFEQIDWYDPNPNVEPLRVRAVTLKGEEAQDDNRIYWDPSVSCEGRTGRFNVVLSGQRYVVWVQIPDPKP